MASEILDGVREAGPIAAALGFAAGIVRLYRAWAHDSEASWQALRDTEREAWDSDRERWESDRQRLEGDVADLRQIVRDHSAALEACRVENLEHRAAMADLRVEVAELRRHSSNNQGGTHGQKQ